MNRLSTIFRPVSSVSQKVNAKLTSKGHALLIDRGLISPSDNGTFFYLPLFQRSLDKLSKLIDEHMRQLDGQKISIPNLTLADLWQKSGRFSNYKGELFLTRDRHSRDYVLGPTFEEAVTKLVAETGPISFRQLPLRLYQIGNKFRDEQMPRHGLLRSREFVMKDLYTFDVDKENAFKTYDEVSSVYEQLFKRISVPYAKVEADATDMGGKLSHEYHFLASIGDEVLSKCSSCEHFFKRSELEQCPKCTENDIEEVHGIEIGHTFYLGDTYTRTQDAHYLQMNGKPAVIEMGCHGIGLTRLIAAAVEALSSETNVRWPTLIAPYLVCIIPPKKGSKEESAISNIDEQIYKELDALHSLRDSIVVDDRSKMTIGKRLHEAKGIGFPLVVVIGSKAANLDNQQFELHYTQTDTSYNLTLSELVKEIVSFAESQTK